VRDRIIGRVEERGMYYIKIFVDFTPFLHYGVCAGLRIRVIVARVGSLAERKRAL